MNMPQMVVGRRSLAIHQCIVIVVVLIVIGQLVRFNPNTHQKLYYLIPRPTTTTTTTTPIQFDEYALQLYMHERRLSLLLSHNDTHNPIMNYLQIYMNIFVRIWNLQSMKMICNARYSTQPHVPSTLQYTPMIIVEIYYQVTFGIQSAVVHMGSLPPMDRNKTYISMHPFDSNWGEFSEYIPYRSTNWGGVNECYDDERKEHLLWHYLNHTNLSAVFTVQVKAFFVSHRYVKVVC